MRYNRVYLNALQFELAPVVVTSSELEDRLSEVYRALHIPKGQIAELTGILERRWWEAGFQVSQGAVAAGRKALEQSSVQPENLEALIYAAVCRENFEPATACRVADGIGVSSGATIYDISNACLGVLNGIVDIANRIELGQIRAGMVVACETAREINDVMIERMQESKEMEMFKMALTTFTGGSGAVALLLTDGSFPGPAGHRLIGGVTQTAPEFHNLCRWWVNEDRPMEFRPMTWTDSVGVIQNGTALGERTWKEFLRQLDWKADEVEKVICHQIGSKHREIILKTLGIPEQKDFSTYEYLGNTGTVALPITAALAQERGFLQPGNRVGFLGIGSGLNCVMLGWEW